MEPRSQDVQLGLTHRPLEAEQQAVVEVGRVVHLVGIGEENLEQGAEFEEPVPVRTRPGQPAHLTAEHDPDVPQRHLGEQALEARSVLDGGAADPLLVVDDQYPVVGPTQSDSRCRNWYCRSADSRLLATCWGVDWRM